MHLVSQGTRYDALCAAISIAYSHGVKDAMLTKFGVNRPTLNKLKKECFYQQKQGGLF